MRNDKTALSLLKDGELCEVITKDGQRLARWSARNWCFYFIDAGTVSVCRMSDIEEWIPAVTKTQ